MIANAQAVELLQTRKDVAQRAEAGLHSLLERSATDPTFRRMLIASPRQALEEFHGHKMPASLNIAFVENTAAVTLVLPDVIDMSAELSEEDLAVVAGGASPATAVTATWVPSLNVVATCLSIIASVTYWLND